MDNELKDKVKIYNIEEVNNVAVANISQQNVQGDSANIAEEVYIHPKSSDEQNTENHGDNAFKANEKVSKTNTPVLISTLYIQTQDIGEVLPCNMKSIDQNNDQLDQDTSKVNHEGKSQSETNTSASLGILSDEIQEIFSFSLDENNYAISVENTENKINTSQKLEEEESLYVVEIIQFDPESNDNNAGKNICEQSLVNNNSTIESRTEASLINTLHNPINDRYDMKPSGSAKKKSAIPAEQGQKCSKHNVPSNINSIDHDDKTFKGNEKVKSQNETNTPALISNLFIQTQDIGEVIPCDMKSIDQSNDEHDQNTSIVNHEGKSQIKTNTSASICILSNEILESSTTCLSLDKNNYAISVENTENKINTTKQNPEEGESHYVVEIIQFDSESNYYNSGKNICEQSLVNKKSTTEASLINTLHNPGNDRLDLDSSASAKKNSFILAEQEQKTPEHNVEEKYFFVEKNVIDRTPLNDDQSKSNLLVSVASTSVTPRKRPSTFMSPEAHKKPKVSLYSEDNGPNIFPIKTQVITDPIIVKNLPEMYNFLPIFGKPTTTLDDYYNKKIREFVGCDLNDKEFEKLSDYCSPKHLRTGKEPTLVLSQRCQLPGTIDEDNLEGSSSDEEELMIIKRKKQEAESAHKYYTAINSWKYRGLRFLPLNPEKDFENTDLEPGKDILLRVRLYRPFLSNLRNKIQRQTRPCVFSCDLVLCGKNTLTDLRERISCPNDISMRVDVSNNPYATPSETVAKDLFPSSFLFINNAFYVDRRPGCKDLSQVIRDWCVSKRIGDFPCRDMNTKLEDMEIRLGHPDVFVHQGNCEHVLAFSEIRLVNACDPLKASSYPVHTRLSLNQTMYCTTCAEFAAKWVVVGCERVPFDPAYFCEPCFKLYLYDDGKKIGDFKAYKYKGNELCIKSVTSGVTE